MTKTTISTAELAALIMSEIRKHRRVLARRFRGLYQAAKDRAASGKLGTRLDL